MGSKHKDLIHSVTIESKGWFIWANTSHENIFTVCDINDKTDHGNTGIYCIYHYLSYFQRPRQYMVPLGTCHSFPYEHQDEFRALWDKFCKLKGIKKHPRANTTTVYNPKRANITMFLDFLKKELDG
jgi:hypothetical protein